MLVIVLPSLRLLNIFNINSKNKGRNIHQSNEKADIAKTSQIRHVAKFKSKKRDLAGNNEFQNMKNKNQSANYSVFLSNKASFKYQVDYSNYNIYGAKNSNFHVTVAKNTTHQAINIGTNSILAITVKVTAPGQKWANLTIIRNFTPTKDMIPTSIHYLILGAKNINDANVSLNMVYEKRTDPVTPITVKIGYFNVNNINANVDTVLSGGAIGGIVIGCVVMAIGFAINLHAVLFDLWERKAIKSATANIQAIIETANDDFKLFKIKNGVPTYGNRKLFTENFKTDTDAMIKIVDRRKIFDGPVQNTIENQTDVMTSSRDKILKAREYYLSTKESRLLRESQEAKTGESEAILPKGGQGANVLGDIRGSATRRVKDSKPFPDTWIVGGEKGERSYLVGSEQNKLAVETLQWKEGKVDVQVMTEADVGYFSAITGFDLNNQVLWKEVTKVGKTHIFFYNRIG